MPEEQDAVRMAAHEAEPYTTSSGPGYNGFQQGDKPARFVSGPASAPTGNSGCHRCTCMDSRTRPLVYIVPVYLQELNVVILILSGCWRIINVIDRRRHRTKVYNVTIKKRNKAGEVVAPTSVSGTTLDIKHSLTLVSGRKIVSPAYILIYIKALAGRAVVSVYILFEVNS